MDYSKLSDFEINLAVFEALHDGSPDCKEGSGGSMVIVSFEGDVVDGNAVEVGVERGVFNPCNNAADAWPIITEKRIMLNPYCADDLWKCEAPCSSDGFMTTYATAYNKNPLRAAMIVYLMMQESK